MIEHFKNEKPDLTKWLPTPGVPYIITDYLKPKEHSSLTETSKTNLGLFRQPERLKGLSPYTAVKFCNREFA